MTPKIVVIKVGTDTLKNMRAFGIIANQISALKRLGYSVILVTSGGVAVGGARIEFFGRDPKEYSKGIRAGVGARHLLNMWGEAFAICGREIAQCYFTYGNLRFKGERERIRTNVRTLAADSLVVPVINENDIISSVEINKMNRGLGDNDRLARVVAVLVEAYALLFVTEKGGVYTANPDTDPSAKLVPVIRATLRRSRAKKYVGSSSNGTGGMASKIYEGSVGTRKGILSGIIGINDVLDFFLEPNVGTRII